MRVREHANARLRHDANDPGSMAAARPGGRSAFPGHPYGQPTEGDARYAGADRAGRLVAAAKRTARPRSAGRRRRRRDRRKGRGRARRPGLRRPAGEGRSQARRRRRRSRASAKIDVDPARRAAIDHPLRPARRSCATIPTIIPSVVAAHVLGGSGNMTSRLFREVREKRGLAYTVFGNLLRLRPRRLSSTAALRPRTSGRANPSTSPRAEIRDVALNGLSDEELEKGKTYLIGSYPLRFDTSAKIASQLVQIQLEGRAPEWLVERNRRDRRGDRGQPQARRRATRFRRRRALHDGGRQAGGILDPSPAWPVARRASFDALPEKAAP